MEMAKIDESIHFSAMAESQLRNLLVALEVQVRMYATPVPEIEMTKAMRYVHSLRKKEHEANIRRLRRFLLKRHKAQPRKLPPKPLFLISE